MGGKFDVQITCGNSLGRFLELVKFSLDDLGIARGPELKGSKIIRCLNKVDNVNLELRGLLPLSVLHSVL